MAYKKIKFKNRVVQRPRTYTETLNQDGSKTLTPAPGEVIEPGTPLSAANLDTEEDALAHISAALDLLITIQQAEIRDAQEKITALEAQVTALASAADET